MALTTSEKPPRHLVAAVLCIGITITRNFNEEEYLDLYTKSSNGTTNLNIKTLTQLKNSTLPNIAAENDILYQCP